MDTIKVGNFIKENRKRKGITQEELANLLHVNRTNISKWERGLRIPNSQYLQELSEYFDISINDILSGEKIKDTDLKKYDNVTLSIMDYYRFKINKVILIFVITFVFVISLLCILFSINNYNSIKVYVSGGQSEHHSISDGLIAISRESMYIKLGFIDSDKEIDGYELYFTNDNKKYHLANGTNNEITYINKFSKDEDYDYDTILKAIDFLYLDVICENKIETIKLNSTLLFKNDKIFYFQNKVHSSNMNDDYMQNIPEYILHNFKYNSEAGQYVKEYNRNNCDYKIIFDCSKTDMNLFDVYENCEYYSDIYSFDINAQHLDFVHKTIKDNKMVFNDYEIEKNNDESAVKYFKKNYLYMLN